MIAIGEAMIEFRPAFHLVMHVAAPLLLALALGGKNKRVAFFWMMASMSIDIDHLWAIPVYEPGRCSIGFHPLHQWPAAMVYLGMVAVRPTRWFGIGALLHLVLDGIDCLMMSG